VIMADRALSTSRRALLGAAAAIPFLPLSAPVRAEPVEAPLFPSPAVQAEWNARLARYQALAARAKAAAETGWFRAANDRYYRESADPTADQEAAFTRLDRAEDLYWRRCTEPMEEAALTLALTTPPSLVAVLAKIAIIRTHQLDELTSMKRGCLEVLAQDVMTLVDEAHRNAQ
jgi:hypothetical protein